MCVYVSPEEAKYGTAAFNGLAHPKYVSYPERLDKSQKESFIAKLEDHAETEEFVRDVQLVGMSQDCGVAISDVESS